MIIYDNGGKSIDRYRIIIDKSVFAMSSNPLSPRGVNQYDCLEKDLKDKRFLGKKIKYSDLNSEVKKAISKRERQMESLD